MLSRSRNHKLLQAASLTTANGVRHLTLPSFWSSGLITASLL